MKRYFLLAFVLSAIITASAQNIVVESFKNLPTDMTASSLEGKRIDQNGQVAALIKVMTTETGFVFEGGTLGIVGTQQRVGEIWVWVPRGLRKITILHQQLGGLRDYFFPVEIEAEHTYEMVLKTGKIEPILHPIFTEQFLVFNVMPKDAMVTVNGIPWPVIDGVAQKKLDFGEYEYRIEASDYHPDAGRIKVNDPDNKVTVSVTLQPAFGFLKIEGDNTLLSQSSIYIDNASGTEAFRNAMRLGSGTHKVRVIHPKYKPYEQTVTITDGDTKVIKVNLNANFSTITLNVDDDAEIWVNNEKKGVRSWTGDLEAGNYTIECRKKNHRSSSVRKTITDNMSGQTIQLESPTPITGTLVVESNPPMAKIVIDGKQIGETPMRVNSLLIGEHTLRLEKPGCAPLAKSIIIEENKTLSLNEKLDTGRSVLVKTDRRGDKIYVDGDYVGETPYETPLGFGSHTIKVVRNGVEVPKTVNIKESNNNGQELVFEFGRMITINTDHEGDVVMVDGNKVGYSPVNVDLPHGSHLIRAEREKKYAEKEIVVQKTGGDTFHYLLLHGETVSDFLKNGVNFITLDVSYDLNSLFSYGFSVGSVKKVGWFVTVSSNLNFDALNYDKTADANGLVDGYFPNYNGETYSTRFSLMGGMAVKMGGPVYFRFGAGYGVRYKCYETYSGDMVKVSSDSFAGLEATAGLQLNLKGFTMSVDAVTTNFQTVEVKLGLGYCWKRK